MIFSLPEDFFFYFCTWEEFIGLLSPPLCSVGPFGFWKPVILFSFPPPQPALGGLDFDTVMAC